MTSFNKLNHAEAERLAILSEECGEVVQIIGKILRHGYGSFNPHDPTKTTNRELLQSEVGHIMAIVQRMVDARDVSHKAIQDSDINKRTSCVKYLHHQWPNHANPHGYSGLRTKRRSTPNHSAFSTNQST